MTLSPHGDTAHSIPQHTLQPSPCQPYVGRHPRGWMDKQTRGWSGVWMDGQTMELHAQVCGSRLQLYVQSFAFCSLEGSLPPGTHTVLSFCSPPAALSCAVPTAGVPEEMAPTREAPPCSSAPTRLSLERLHNGEKSNIF